MSKTAYNITLKGCVGGEDFDRNTVDRTLADNEGFISHVDFDHIKEYTEMCDKHGVDAVDDYMDLDHDDLDDFEEAYCGEWDSEEDFARHIIDEHYDLERTMDSLTDYFDYGR